MIEQKVDGTALGRLVHAEHQRGARAKLAEFPDVYVPPPWEELLEDERACYVAQAEQVRMAVLLGGTRAEDLGRPEEVARRLRQERDHYRARAFSAEAEHDMLREELGRHLAITGALFGGDEAVRRLLGAEAGETALVAAHRTCRERDEAREDQKNALERCRELHMERMDIREMLGALPDETIREALERALAEDSKAQPTEDGQEELAEIVHLAHARGWNGTSNSKILHRFLAGEFACLEREIQECKRQKLAPRQGEYAKEDAERTAAEIGEARVELARRRLVAGEVCACCRTTTGPGDRVSGRIAAPGCPVCEGSGRVPAGLHGCLPPRVWPWVEESR